MLKGIVFCVCVGIVGGCVVPPGGGGSTKSHKGCACGNSYIDCSKTCHNGSTYRKRHK